MLTVTDVEQLAWSTEQLLVTGERDIQSELLPLNTSQTKYRATYG